MISPCTGNDTSANVTTQICLLSFYNGGSEELLESPGALHRSVRGMWAGFC